MWPNLIRRANRRSASPLNARQEIGHAVHYAFMNKTLAAEFSVFLLLPIVLWGQEEMTPARLRKLAQRSPVPKDSGQSCTKDQ